MHLNYFFFVIEVANVHCKRSIALEYSIDQHMNNALNGENNISRKNYLGSQTS
jgi:hypothetical protein